MQKLLIESPEVQFIDRIVADPVAESQQAAEWSQVQIVAWVPTNQSTVREVLSNKLHVAPRK